MNNLITILTRDTQKECLAYEISNEKMNLMFNNIQMLNEIHLISFLVNSNKFLEEKTLRIPSESGMLLIDLYKKQVFNVNDEHTFGEINKMDLMNEYRINNDNLDKKLSIKNNDNNNLYNLNQALKMGADIIINDKKYNEVGDTINKFMQRFQELKLMNEFSPIEIQLKDWKFSNRVNNNENLQEVYNFMKSNDFRLNLSEDAIWMNIKAKTKKMTM